MSESFADCKDFLQLKEQDFFRLKLQHALDLKVELITDKESFCERKKGFYTYTQSAYACCLNALG